MTYIIFQYSFQYYYNNTATIIYYVKLHENFKVCVYANYSRIHTFMHANYVASSRPNERATYVASKAAVVESQALKAF